MKSSNVPKVLYEEIQVAVKDIYRYERIDRFALSVVLSAAENNNNVENTFLNQAKQALKNHPAKKRPVAA